MSDTRTDQLNVLPPAQDKPPLKVNVYQHMQLANTQLAPLFPYHGEGDIVPTGIIFRGGDGDDYGFFQHTNTVDEVGLCWGGAGSRVRAGQVSVGGRTHGVGGHGMNDPQFFIVMTVTQRQVDGQIQSEAIQFLCEKCQQELFRLEFPANMRAVAESGASPSFADFSRFPPLATIEGTERAAENYNADEAKHKCSECGHKNRPFPNRAWGWWQYVKHTQIVEKARETLDEAGGGKGSAS